MTLTCTYHGRLTELVNTQEETLQVQAETASMLRQALIDKHPELLETTFQIAQANKILQGDDLISEMNIDVFPPFSGG